MLLKDHRRLKTAINAARAKSGRPLLDILAIVLAHLPEILAAIGNPAALLALILSLLNTKPKRKLVKRKSAKTKPA